MTCFYKWKSNITQITALSKSVEDLRKDTEPMEKLRDENARLLMRLNNVEEGSAKKRKSPGFDCVLPQTDLGNATWWFPTATKQRKAGPAVLAQQHSTAAIWHHENKRLYQLFSELRPTPGTNTVQLREALVEIFEPGVSLILYKEWKEDNELHGTRRCLYEIVGCGLVETETTPGRKCESCDCEGKKCVHVYRDGGITYVAIVGEDDDSDDSDEE